MKKLIMIAALFIGFNVAAEAQDAKKERGSRNMTPEQRAAKQADRMQQALQLSEDQKKAIYDLNIQSGREMQALKKESREKNKEQFKAIHQRKDARMKAVLSADQYTKYQAMKAERMKKMGEKKGPWKGKGEGKHREHGAAEPKMQNR